MNSRRYWEHEQPVTIDTGKNVLRYFAQSGKLQVSMPYWTGEDGEKKPGKTVTLDIASIQNTPEALSLFRNIVKLSA